MHPLTSKERRGLVAVAAAALLCIASGFAFRNCSAHAPRAGVVIVDDSAAADSAAHAAKEPLGTHGAKGKSGKKEKSGKEKKGNPGKENKEKTEKGKKGKSGKGKKKAPEKVYPVREPLDEPILESGHWLCPS